MRCCLIWLFTFLMIPAMAQERVSLLGQLGYDVRSSDIWGWESETGRKYAIVGLFNGTSLVDITEPTAPIEVVFIEGPESIWRDMKVWNNHAYITNETSGGLFIIDLNDLPAFPDTASFTGNDLSSAHNIFIDENGVAYLLGSNILGGGAVFLDLTGDPLNPVFLGAYEEQYIHDAFIRGDTMWAAEIYVGRTSVVDVSDKSNPVVLSAQESPSAFTHNTWVSGDGNYLFSTDEVSGGYVAAYDVSDIFDIREIARYRSSPGSGVIAHNTFWHDGYLITSYYRDGITVVDAHQPDNLIEVGYYDTSPFESDNGFNGCWGVYPYFTDGLMIGSDIEEGLFILQPDYQRASYLEGVVMDVVTGLPAGGAQIEVLTTENKVFSAVNGLYKTGAAFPGMYDIRISKPGCVTVIETGVELEQGLVTELPVMLNCTATVAIEDVHTMEMMALPTAFKSSCMLIVPDAAAAAYATVNIYSLNGTLAERHLLQPGRTHLMVGEQLPSGMYLAALQYDNQPMQRLRIVKQD